MILRARAAVAGSPGGEASRASSRRLMSSVSGRWLEIASIGCRSERTARDERSMVFCEVSGALRQHPHPLSPQSGSGAFSPGASVQLLQQEVADAERVSTLRTSAVIRIEQQQSGSITARKAARARCEMGSWRITGACSRGGTGACVCTNRHRSPPSVLNVTTLRAQPNMCGRHMEIIFVLPLRSSPARRMKDKTHETVCNLAMQHTK